MSLLDGDREADFWRAKLEVTTACAGVGYLECRPDGTGVKLDATAMRLFEYEDMQQVHDEASAQIQRWELSDLDGRVLPPDEWPTFRALRGDFVTNRVLHLRSLITGVELDCEVNTAPVYDDDGAICLIINTVRDVTTEQAADRIRRDLEELLRSQALTDPLTGIPNRRAFLDQGEREIARARRQSQTVALALLDLDDLKSINDQQGHASGDLALIEMARAVSGTVRDFDLFGRLGGDEFALLLVDVTAQEALATLERIRSRVADTRLQWSDSPFRVTMSAGLCAVTPKGASVNELLASSDRALYAAKAAGRNRVVACWER